MPEEKMRAIQQLFVREALDKISRAKESLDKLDAMPDDIDAFKIVYLFFHTVVASGGTLGLDNIISEIKPVEKKLAQISIDGQIPDHDLIILARESMDTLQKKMTLFLEEKLAGPSVESAKEISPKPCYKILLADDDSSFRALVKPSLVEKGYQVLEAENLPEARKVLGWVYPDLAILEVTLQGDSGLDFCKEIKANPRFELMPVIMLTNNTELADCVEGLKAGADDCIAKPVEADELLVKVESLLHLAEERLNKAIKEPLTGLYSRKFFLERLNEEKERFNRNHRPFTVALFNLDNFKQVNDNYGHLVGDFVLREFANHLGKQLRQTDLVARSGGDEFIALMPETTAKLALKAIERISGAWAGKKLIEPNNNFQISITFSAGIAEFGTDISTDTDLLMAVEQALYAAKRSGKNRVFAHQEAGDKTTSDPLKILIVDDSIIVRSALKNGLEAKGYKIYTACDGHEALALIDKFKPDVSIIDLNMPKLNGIQLTREIKDKNAGLKIMAYTGERNKKTVIEALKAGVDDYLIKPLRVDELEKRILRLVKRHTTV